MADKKKIDLGRIYSGFTCIGTLHLGEDAVIPKTVEGKNSTVLQYGYMDKRTGIAKNGKAYASRSLKLSIETDGKDKTYLDLGDFNMEGNADTFYFRAKGAKKFNPISMDLATDKNTIDQAESWTVKKFEIGDFVHETLDIKSLMDMICDNPTDGEIDITKLTPEQQMQYQQMSQEQRDKELLARKTAIKTQKANLRASLRNKRVVVYGNVVFSEYEKKAQAKYEIKSIRNPYPDEKDKLEVNINAIYTKNSIKLPAWETLANQEFIKIPLNFNVPITTKKFSMDADGKKVYEVELLPLDNIIGLNVSMFDFNNPAQKPMYEAMANLLATKQVMGADGKLTNVALAPTDIYLAKFFGNIKTTSKGGDLNEADLTPQEKFYMSMNQKTLADIKKERGIKQVTNSIINLDIIPYDAEKIEVNDETLHKVPENITASKAFAQPMQIPTPIGQATPVVPNFNMGTQF